MASTAFPTTVSADPHARPISVAAATGLVSAYLFLTVASVVAQMIPPLDLGAVSGSVPLRYALPFLAVAALTPTIAHRARTQSTWPTLSVANGLAAAGALLLFADLGSIVDWLAATALDVAALIAGAAVLIAAWRARSGATPVLAAAFVVVGTTLPEPVATEIWLSSFSSRGDHVVILLGCIAAAFALSSLVLADRHLVTPEHEHALSTTDRLGLSFVLFGIALFTTSPVGFSGARSIIGLTIVLVGAVLLIVARRTDLATNEPIHLDLALVGLCGISVAMLALIDVGTWHAPSWPFETMHWFRVTNVAGIVAAVPLVILTARHPRSMLTLGALVASIAGSLLVAFPQTLEQTDTAVLTTTAILEHLAVAVLLGGTITLALERVDGASVEAGVIIFLIGAPLVRTLSLRVTTDTSFGPPDDRSELVIVGAIGMACLAAWWVMRRTDRTDLERANEIHFHEH